MSHVVESDLCFLEAHELARLIRDGEISSVEATRAQLARIAAIDSKLCSYALVMEEMALAEAARADAERAEGTLRGPLHGVPVGIKDLCWVAGYPTAAGTSVYRDFVPYDDATVVQRLRQGGAVILGKLQLTEGAYSDHHPTITPPKNPWDERYWTGISSSGSAAALAGGLCYGALGTDTGGSIRWPSAATGITGLKPTWGRVSRHGVFELASTLDHVGTMARSAVDAALLLSTIAGEDPRDPTCLQMPASNYNETFEQGVTGVRIGIDRSFLEEDVDKEVRDVVVAAAQCFADLRAELVEVALPDLSQIISDWAPTCAVEAAVAHESVYPARKSEYGPVLSGVLEAGRALSGMDYQKLILRRLAFRGTLAAAIKQVDLLLLPAQPFGPLTLDAIRTLGEQPALIAKLQRFTCPFNMTGNPTLTLPGGFARNGLPIGFQLIANHLHEDVLVRAGAAYQSVTTWHKRHPAWS